MRHPLGWKEREDLTDHGPELIVECECAQYTRTHAVPIYKRDEYLSCYWSLRQTSPWHRDMFVVINFRDEKQIVNKMVINDRRRSYRVFNLEDKTIHVYLLDVINVFLFIIIMEEEINSCFLIEMYHFARSIFFIRNVFRTQCCLLLLVRLSIIKKIEHYDMSYKSINVPWKVHRRIILLSNTSIFETKIFSEFTLFCALQHSYIF